MTVLEEIHASGTEAVLSGRFQRQVPPVDGGRWGMSMLLLASADLAEALDKLTSEVLEVAGSGHWATGSLGSAHLTIRALQTYRSARNRDRADEARYGSVMKEAARDLGPARFGFSGLQLSPAAVLVRAEDINGVGTELRTRLATSVTSDFESLWTRDPVWYLSLVHFAAEIINPPVLVDWINDRFELDVGLGEFPALDLCRFDFDGHRPAPTSVACALLEG